MREYGTRAEGAGATLEYGLAPAGYRLPDATRLGRVRLRVGGLQRSLDFYDEVLGLRLQESGEGRAALAAEPDGAALVELEEQEGVTPLPIRGRLGLYHYAILLPDRAALGRFVRHLRTLGMPFGASDHLVSEALYLNDADGLGIEVYADRPRSAWRHQQRQLIMATEPLDLDDLMVAAAGERWSGMPADAVIGHIHLFVGDLRQAAAFYHEGLGFDRTVWSYPGALFLSAGGYHHHLGLNTWAGPAAVPPRDNEARLLEWELVLPSDAEAEDAASSLQAAGNEARNDGAWTVVDPWGTPLRITAAGSGRPSSES